MVSRAPKTLAGMPAAFSAVAESLGLCGRVGMLGDVHDQERRNAFSPGYVRDGGEVAMLRRVVAEFLAVTELRLRLTVDPTRVSAVSMMAGTS